MDNHRRLEGHRAPFSEWPTIRPKPLVNNMVSGRIYPWDTPTSGHCVTQDSPLLIG